MMEAAPVSLWARVRAVAIPAIAALFLAFSGAFGSGAAPFGKRLLTWVLAIGFGSVVGEFMTERLTRRWMPSRPVLALALATLAIIVPVTLFVTWLFGVMFNGGAVDWGQAWAMAGPVALVTLAMQGVHLLDDRQPLMTHAAPEAAGELAREPAVPPAPPAAARRSAFLDRVPEKLRGAALIAVEAEDHYLRVHTTAGNDLVLMRLADALAQLDGIEGAQTHRGWWVARGAVEGVRREGSRVVLLLRGGVEAPVSRSFVSALRGAGWW